MIRGYPRYPSCYPGETLVLHVSTDSPRFRVAFFRQGAALERMAGGPSEVLAGIAENVHFRLPPELAKTGAEGRPRPTAA